MHRAEQDGRRRDRDDAAVPALRGGKQKAAKEHLFEQRGQHDAVHRRHPHHRVTSGGLDRCEELLVRDLHAERLAIALTDVELGERAEVAFLNSKGFGGNNATGVALAPQVVEGMLARRHGARAMDAWQARREAALEAAAAYDAECCAGPMRPIYRFGDALIDEEAIEIDARELRLPGFAQGVTLAIDNRYADMTG